MALIQNTYTLPDKMALFEQVSSVSLGTGSAYAHNGIFSSTYDTYFIIKSLTHCYLLKLDYAYYIANQRYIDFPYS